MVTANEDFAEGQIFFLSLMRDEWVPTHVRGYERGYIQLFTFSYIKKLEVENWLEYHSLFDYNSKLGYVLSKKGQKLIDKEGYDFIHFVGDELDECFLVNPAEQVTNILSLRIKGNQNETLRTKSQESPI